MAQQTQAPAKGHTHLSDSQINFFLTNGWLKLSNCFSRSQAATIQGTLWTRLGMNPNDPSTWHTERTNMPHHNTFDVASFAPTAWQAICDLLGGEERVDNSASTWKDSFIVNLGTPSGHNQTVKPQALQGWHVDGDFFVHYLDSPEQGLLVIPLFTDIAPHGGGTFICPPAIKLIAEHLYAHPEGVSPRMTPRAENPSWEPEPRVGLSFFNGIAAGMRDEDFVEATGEVGDVYLLHPLMLHTASNNALRVPRVITNPPVSLKRPFVFDREDEGAYSVVERKTLRELGRERLEGFRIEGKREGIVPERVRVQERMKREEMERLERLKGEGVVKTKEVAPVA